MSMSSTPSRASAASTAPRSLASSGTYAVKAQYRRRTRLPCCRAICAAWSSWSRISTGSTPAARERDEKHVMVESRSDTARIAESPFARGIDMKRWLALVLLLPMSACGYNTIQKLDEAASSAQGQIEVQLQRRADLIPNLVSTMKGYAQHEEQVFIQVAQARSGLVNAIQTHDAEQMANANAQLTSSLGRLMVSVEAYPQLKADQSFIRLHDEPTSTEN